MYKKFEELKEKFSVTSYQVSKDTGIAQSILSNWKKGHNPKIDKLQIIAAYFGESIEYFLGTDITESERSKIFRARNKQEIELLQLYRSIDHLPIEKKEIVIDTFKTLVNVSILQL